MKPPPIAVISTIVITAEPFLAVISVLFSLGSTELWSVSVGSSTSSSGSSSEGSGSIGTYSSESSIMTIRSMYLSGHSSLSSHLLLQNGSRYTAHRSVVHRT